MAKTTYGKNSKVFIQAYVPVDVYEFMMQEKGEGSLSGFVCALLQEYKTFAQDDEQNNGENENKMIA